MTVTDSKFNTLGQLQISYLYLLICKLTRSQNDEHWVTVQIHMDLIFILLNLNSTSSTFTVLAADLFFWPATVDLLQHVSHLHIYSTDSCI